MTAFPKLVWTNLVFSVPVIHLTMTFENAKIAAETPVVKRPRKGLMQSLSRIFQWSFSIKLFSIKTFSTFSLFFSSIWNKQDPLQICFPCDHISSWVVWYILPPTAQHLHGYFSYSGYFPDGYCIKILRCLSFIMIRYKCMWRAAPKSWSEYTTCIWWAAHKSWSEYTTFNKVEEVN